MSYDFEGGFNQFTYVKKPEQNLVCVIPRSYLGEQGYVARELALLRVVNDMRTVAGLVREMGQVLVKFVNPTEDYSDDFVKVEPRRNCCQPWIQPLYRSRGLTVLGDQLRREFTAAVLWDGCEHRLHGNPIHGGGG